MIVFILLIEDNHKDRTADSTSKGCEAGGSDHQHCVLISLWSYLCSLCVELRFEEVLFVAKRFIDQA